MTAQPTIATLTVMRGEWTRMERLLPTLAWAAERHIVETAATVIGTPSQLEAGAQVHHLPLLAGQPFDGARAAALPWITSDWILVVDTDERVPDTLVQYLQNCLPSWADGDLAGAWIARRNHVRGRPLRYSSAWPDYQLRLLRRTSAQLGDQLHAGVSVAGPTLHLPAHDDLAFQHFAFHDTAQFLSKLNNYSTIEAAQREPERGMMRSPVAGAIRVFAARYFKMQGFRDGRDGFHFSLLMALYEYLVREKRWEFDRKPRDSE